MTTSRRPKRVRKDRSDIRDELLDAALIEFAAKGFHGASTRAIAARIHAHQPQIHYHFESKEALWRAAVDRLFAKLQQELAVDVGALDTVSAQAEAMAHLIRRFVHFAAAHPELNQIMVHEATEASDRLKWMVERHVRPIYDAGRSLWRRLADAGIAAPIDERFFHYVLVGAASMVYVNSPEARLLTGIDPSKGRWIDAHADGLIAMLLPKFEVRRGSGAPRETKRK